MGALVYAAARGPRIRAPGANTTSSTRGAGTARWRAVRMVHGCRSSDRGDRQWWRWSWPITASRSFRSGPWVPSIYATTTLVVLTVIGLARLAAEHELSQAVELRTVGAISAVVVIGLSSSVATGRGTNANDCLKYWHRGSCHGVPDILYLRPGWNEAAYLSAELRDVKRNMVRMLMDGTLIVGARLDVLINLNLSRGACPGGDAHYDAVAAETLFRSSGAHRHRHRAHHLRRPPSPR